MSMKDVIAKVRKEGGDLNNAVTAELRAMSDGLAHALSVGERAIPAEAGVALERAMEQLQIAAKSIITHPRSIDDKVQRGPELVEQEK